MVDFETGPSDPPDDIVLPEASRAAPVLIEYAPSEFSQRTSPPAEQAISPANSHTREKWAVVGGKKELKMLRPGT
jgi:hypothetical protein